MEMMDLLSHLTAQLEQLETYAEHTRIRQESLTKLIKVIEAHPAVNDAFREYLSEVEACPSPDPPPAVEHS